MRINMTKLIHSALFLAPLFLTACGGGGGGGGGGDPVASTATTPRFAYVANAGDNTISIYTVNASTGQLRANGYMVAGITPRSVTVAPSGKFAYVANSGSHNISAYTINASTGALTFVSIVPAGNGLTSAPQSVTVDPFGQFAFVANSGSSNVSAYTIDQNSGALALAGTIAAGDGATSIPESVTIHPSGLFAYVANSVTDSISVYNINVFNGTLTLAMEVTSGGLLSPKSVTVDSSGKFAYVANAGATNVSAYTIDTAGALTAMTGLPFTAGSAPLSVTVDPSGKFAYVANSGSSNVSAFTIATTGVLGALVSAGNVPAGDGVTSIPQSVTVDPSGKFAYVTNSVTNDVSSYTINANTGALTAAASTRARSGSTYLAMSKGTAPVTYTPKYAYVADYGSDSVLAYSINDVTGQLSPLGSPVYSGDTPASIAVTPSGKFVYVANNGLFVASSVSAFKIEATGALTQVNCATGCLGLSGNEYPAGTNPVSVAVDPSGKFVFVANALSNDISAYRIDQTTGELTPIDADSITPLIQNFMSINGTLTPYSVTVDPTGQFVYVANFDSNDISAFSIDATTGALTEIGTPFPAGGSPSSVTIDPTGKFAYVTNSSAINNNVSTYSIDVTGALTSVADITAGITSYSVTVDPTGKFAYVTNAGDATVSTYTIDITTGQLTHVGVDVATGNAPYSVNVDPSGKFAYVANYAGPSVSAYAINTTTGVLASLGSPIAAGNSPQSITTTGTIQ